MNTPGAYGGMCVSVGMHTLMCQGRSSFSRGASPAGDVGDLQCRTWPQFSYTELLSSSRGCLSLCLPTPPAVAAWGPSATLALAL